MYPVYPIIVRNRIDSKINLYSSERKTGFVWISPYSMFPALVQEFYNSPVDSPTTSLQQKNTRIAELGAFIYPRLPTAINLIGFTESTKDFYTTKTRSTIFIGLSRPYVTPSKAPHPGVESTPHLDMLNVPVPSSSLVAQLLLYVLLMGLADQPQPRCSRHASGFSYGKQ